MSRLARVVIPGLPHHVTQRGNRREPVFFNDADYAFYTKLILTAAQRANCEVWAGCLMPNHVHMIIVPSDEDGLRRMFADAHRRYTVRINARLNVTGHLWQGRFGSVAMDEAHLYEAVRYVALNPVRAGLVSRARDWQWATTGLHLAGTDDRAFKAQPVLDRVGDFAAYIDKIPLEEPEQWQALRRAETIGRPLGDDEWLSMLEAQTGRTLAVQRRGRKAPRT